MRNETENTKPIINNSSLITTENSSLQSRLNAKRNKLIIQRNNKYSNTVIFEKRQRDFSKTTTNSKSKNGIYLTDILLSKNREIDSQNKTTTLESSKNTSTTFKKTKKNKYKRSLPNIRNSSRTNNSPYFTCCDYKMNPKLLKRLYNEQYIYQEKTYENVNMNQNKLKHYRTFRETKNDFIRKTNEIKRFKYEIDIKKGAMEDYKQNIRTKICGLEKTINDIQSYKNILENNFLSKYNEEIRKLERELLEDRLKDDENNRNLKILKNEVNSLKVALVKKQNVFKNIQKWIFLQIFIKEGVEPKNLKKSLEKYQHKLIFEKPEDLENCLDFKETENLRLIEKYNRIEREKEKYKQEYNDIKKELGNDDQEIDSILVQKESLLNSLKKKELSLKNKLYKLKIEKRNYQTENSNKIKRCKSSTNTYINNQNLFSFQESDLQTNELGILYKPVKFKNNIFDYIDCIYATLMSNNINWPSTHLKYFHQMYNIGITKSKKSVIKMKIIEVSLNYLFASINKKVINNKQNLLIKEKVCKIIDLYHKKINGNKNKLEQQKYRETLLNRIKEKNSKVHYLPRGKIEKYNIVNIQKKREEERIKNKKAIKKVDIWDFLYDISKDENENNEI